MQDQGCSVLRLVAHPFLLCLLLALPKVYLSLGLSGKQPWHTETANWPICPEGFPISIPTPKAYQYSLPQWSLVPGEACKNSIVHMIKVRHGKVGIYSGA